MEPSQHKLEVKRTAAYYVLGELNAHTRQLWVVLHGYGQHPWHWIKKFSPLLQQAHTAVVAPEALSKFYVQGQSGRVGASWMTADRRTDEIADYAHYLRQLVALLSTQAPNCSKILLGFSQGGATAARVAALQPNHWQALVLWSAVFPPDMPAELPPALPGYLVYGQTDPYLQAEHLQLLQQNDAWPHFERMAFEGGHEIVSELLGPLQARVVERLK